MMTSCHLWRYSQWGGVHPALVSVTLWTGDGFPASQSPFLGMAAYSLCWVGLFSRLKQQRSALDAQSPGFSLQGLASLVMRVVLTHCLVHSAVENKAVLQDFFIPWSHTIELLMNLM